jgi:hypothetical protein
MGLNPTPLRAKTRNSYRAPFRIPVETYERVDPETVATVVHAPVP